MLNKILNNPLPIKNKIYKKYDKNIKISLYKFLNNTKILGNMYWSYLKAYGEYSQEEGQSILELAEIDFNEAFEIVASWEKEKSLPE